ncbi:MAG TPA: C2H2-type zinc finger protein [Nitrososphaeraceae archaeon]
MAEENERFTCPICGNNFDTQKALNWHKETDHDGPISPPRHNR